jgi:prepilin-type N-terminal cleavage/methylation domain-containing protein
LNVGSRTRHAAAPTVGPAGFTLVEVALVLVIVGLLLGGILKGQEIIVQSKIKNAIADYNGVLAGYSGYIDRYRSLPGDDEGAHTRWNLNATQSGNGNAVINHTYNSVNDADESRKFWLHLRLAGFIPGAGSAQPANAHTGILGVQTGDGNGGATLANTGLPPVAGIGGVMICASQVPDKVAIAVDNQTDDGQARSGQVRALAASGAAAIDATSMSEAGYVESGVSTYVLCRAL